MGPGEELPRRLDPSRQIRRLTAGALTPLAAAGALGIAVNLTFGLTWSAGYAANGGYGFALLLMAMATAVAFLGPGRFSIDRLIRWPWPMSGMKAGAAALALGAVVGSLVLTGSEPNFPEFPSAPTEAPAN
ncbi:MAG TPA: DoxX family protein [Acidimicrobiia bacterium]|jgi:putative oxidoreductase